MIITPKTKILDLIEAYPELEQVLFEMSPAFKKLQNPILRKTVARVATLQQAALVGNIPVEKLINDLRARTGQEGVTSEEPDSKVARSNQKVSGNKVVFKIDKSKVSMTMDAREMLNRGEQPVAQVLADLHILPQGEVYELIAPFYPAPLIDKATGLGFTFEVVEKGPEEYHIFFLASAR